MHTFHFVRSGTIGLTITSCSFGDPAEIFYVYRGKLMREELLPPLQHQLLPIVHPLSITFTELDDLPQLRLTVGPGESVQIRTDGHAPTNCALGTFVRVSGKCCDPI